MLTATEFGSQRGARDRHGPLVNQSRVGAVHEYAEIRKREGAKLLTGVHSLADGVPGHKAVEEFSEIKTIFVSSPNTPLTLTLRQPERLYQTSA